MRENVYYGKNSTAKILIDKTEKVDKSIEVAALGYAVAYDAANKWLLTRTDKLKRATIKVINGRFKVLYILAKKVGGGSRLFNFLRQLHTLALQRIHDRIDMNSYIQKIRAIATNYLPAWVIRHVEHHINMYNDLKHAQLQLMGLTTGVFFGTSENNDIDKLIKQVFI